MLDMHRQPKILGLILYPKLAYNKHIDNTSAKASKTLPILKVLSSTKQGKHKETLLLVYKDQCQSIHPLCGHLLHLLQNYTKHGTTHCNWLHADIWHLHDEKQTYYHHKTSCIPNQTKIITSHTTTQLKSIQHQDRWNKLHLWCI